MSWNKNNPALRRIHADIKELSKHPSENYRAVPLEENMFEWHFSIRGPAGTDFEGGRYHGRIVLPAEYPFKPPSIVFLTPNGRWKTKEKICLSISNYHPEHWQPAWGVRTILEAIISFMTAPGEGAIGAIEVPAEERKRLAKASLKYTHPLMPELPEVKVNQSDTPSEEEDFENEIFTSNPETETNSPEPENYTSSTVDDMDTNNSESETSPNQDRVDKLLGQLSMALLISIFALLYRKALQLYT